MSCRSIDSESTDGNPYIAMELVEGRLLRVVLEHERLTARRGLELMRQVAAGMAAIHTSGILHRDLSTNNIVVTDSGSPKILGLELAKDMSRFTSIDSGGGLLGTPPSVSPEQIEKARAATRAPRCSPSA